MEINDKPIATGEDQTDPVNPKGNIFKEKDDVASKADRVLAKMEDFKKEQLI